MAKKDIEKSVEKDVEKVSGMFTVVRNCQIKGAYRRKDCSPFFYEGPMVRHLKKVSK